MTEPGQRGQPANKIPDFHSREEEAAFWDSHDFTEFLDESRPVTLRIGKQLSAGLSVRPDRHDRQELEQRASEQSMGPSILVRMWIKERLRGTPSPST